MASPWIKITHDFPDKEEVHHMAYILQIDSDAVSGKLVRLFIWADQNTTDGQKIRLADPFIDHLTRCPGFAAAMRDARWLSGRNGCLTIPNFTRHNGQSAKARALATDRQTRLRRGDVTPPPLHQRDKSVTREEKRREEGEEEEYARPASNSPPQGALNFETSPGEAEEEPKASKAKAPNGAEQDPTGEDSLALSKRILGEEVWDNDGGKWINRIRANPGKVERVMRAIEFDRKEGKAIERVGGYAEDLWTRFADH